MALFLGGQLFAQEIEKDEDGFVAIPELSKKIVIKGKSIKIDEAHFKYLPEYTYTNGIVYGSWIKFYLDGIEDVNSFEDKSLILTKERVYRKSDEKVVYSVDWSFGDDGEDDAVVLDNDEHLVYTSKLELGSPIWSDDYVWEITVANFCNGDRVTLSVPFTIVPNSAIKTKTSGGAGVKEICLWNKDKKYLYAGTEINQGKLSVPIYDITGFKMQDGLYKVGVSTEFTNAKGEVIVSDEDLAKGSDAFIEPTEEGTLELWPYIDIKSDVAQQFITYKITVWDKLGKGVVETEIKVFVK